MAKKVKTAAKVSQKTTKSVAKAAAPKQTRGGNTVLKTICAKVGIDPKTARRVLRKRMRTDKPEIAKFHTIKTRWVQDAKAAATIESVLRDYAQAA